MPIERFYVIAHPNATRPVKNPLLRSSETMCLGIPMRVETLEGHTARCTTKGVYRDVSLFMLQDEKITVGDFVIVHVGYAIQKLTPQEARSAWELYDEMSIAASDNTV